MTYETVKKLHKHFSLLASGNFNERNLDGKVKAKNPGEESGTIIMGEMTPERRRLIISDAKRHKRELEEKFPELAEEEKKPKKKIVSKKESE